MSQRKLTAIHAVRHVGHVTIFSRMLATTCCLTAGLGLGLVSGWLKVIFCIRCHCHSPHAHVSC